MEYSAVQDSKVQYEQPYFRFEAELDRWGNETNPDSTGSSSQIGFKGQIAFNTFPNDPTLVHITMKK